MPKRIIDYLTEEQEAMIPIYRDKWRSLSLLTEPIDREKAAAVIKAAYVASEYPEPEILFYSNPYKAIEQILSIENFEEYLGRDISSKFTKKVMHHIEYGIKQQLEDRLLSRLRNQIQFPEFPYYPTESNPRVSFFPYHIERCTRLQLLYDFNKKPEFQFANISNLVVKLTRPAGRSILGCMFDFCISILGVQHDKQKWKVLQDLMQYCGFIFQFEKVCLTCDRPIKLSFDEENMLHAEGEPALLFADGYSVYAERGKHFSEIDR